MTDGPDYLLQLRPLANAVPVPIRLRALLKAALRAYGFRAVSVAEVQPDQATGQEPAPGCAAGQASKNESNQ